MSPTALVVSPHPDDELFPAGGALLALADEGWRIVNFACGLGRSEQHVRRRAELEDACGRAGFELRVLDPPAAISSSDDLLAAERRLTNWVRKGISDERAELVVSPSPHDRHHGHELGGRVARNALELTGDSSPRWWMWRWWGDMPYGNLFVPITPARMQVLRHSLSAHAGEVVRGRYLESLDARTRDDAITGVEQVFGFGSDAAADVEFAHVLTEAQFRGGMWRLTTPRSFESPPVLGEINITPWVEGASWSSRLERYLRMKVSPAERVLPTRISAFERSQGERRKVVAILNLAVFVLTVILALIARGSLLTETDGVASSSVMVLTPVASACVNAS